MFHMETIAALLETTVYKTWIPMDGSFKQYTYTQGIDIKSAVPFDAKAFMNNITNGATIDVNNSSVTNINSQYFQSSLLDYQTQVHNYIAQNYPNSTVGNVIGNKTIIRHDFPYLAGTLPYSNAIKGAIYSTVPDNLRHKITFSVVKDSYDNDFGTPINITKSLPEIAGKKITLSYSPATSQDEAVINSYIPQAHADGSPIQPTELPSSLPAYLINVRPELKIDGNLLSTGTVISLGTSESLIVSFSSPNGFPSNAEHNITAGSFIAIGIDPSTNSLNQLQDAKQRLDSTKAKFDNSEYSELNREDVVGDLLYAAALSYYTECDAFNLLQGKKMGIATLRHPSEGIFSVAVDPIYLFGIPRSASVSGIGVDVVQDVISTSSFNGDNSKRINFMLLSGHNGSALENTVLEQLFSTQNNPADAVSAVKALNIANDQGIPIYTITRNNINTIIPQLQLDADVKTDIVNAVNAGKIVNVSQKNITVNSWNGCGYIIIDPNTGDAAYMISGGLSGGFWCVLYWLVMVLLVTILIVCVTILVIAAFLPEVIAAASAAILDIELLATAFIMARPVLNEVSEVILGSLETYDNTVPRPPWELPIPTEPWQIVTYLYILRGYVFSYLSKVTGIFSYLFIGKYKLWAIRKNEKYLVKS